MEAFPHLKPFLAHPHRNLQRCKSSSQEAFSSCSIFSGFPRSFQGFPRKPFCTSRNQVGRKFEFLLKNNALPYPKQRKMRQSTIVRSELVEAGGSGDSVYSFTEFQWGSKLRGICFYAVTALAAICLFLVMLVAHPFVLLFDRYRRKAHHLVAMIWASLSVKPFVSINVEGLENLPPSNTPAVYVSNHQSFLDIYTLFTLGRGFKFISKTTIFLIPIVGWAMYMMGTIPLRRLDTRSQLECFKRCMDLVRKGASIFFFPEGTRSKDGKLGIFKKGAFTVAAKTGVPVVPITLLGTGKLMPPGTEGILNRGSIKVVIHKPIEGNDPELLCTKARNVIADALLHGDCAVGHIE